jgi:hypothetical protein
MASSGMLCHVTLVVTNQKMPFFIVTAMKTSNLPMYYLLQTSVVWQFLMYTANVVLNTDHIEKQE